MTPDDDVDGQGDVGSDGDDEPSLAELANLVHGDPDEGAIDEESPRAADDDNYGWLEANDGQVVIFDERNPWAWLSSGESEDLDDRE